MMKQFMVFIIHQILWGQQNQQEWEMQQYGKEYMYRIVMGKLKEEEENLWNVGVG